MWWWVSAFFILLAVGDHIASGLAAISVMPLSAADTLIARALIVSFAGAAICIGLDVKESVRASYIKFADRLGMDVEPARDNTFIEQAGTPPWTTWARASDFVVRATMRSRSKSPEHWIFDLHYREQVLGMKRPTVTTFIAVRIDDAAPPQVQEWMVPQGYRALRSDSYLYVWRVKSWFGGGDRLGISAIADMLRVALLIASDVVSLGTSATANMKERVTLAMEEMNGLNKFSFPLLVIAWVLNALLLVDAPVPGRPLIDMLLIQAAFGCAAYGSVWRRDRNPTFIIFMWLVSLALFWMPPVAMILLTLAAVEAMLGVLSIGAGLHLAVVLAAGLSLYGMQHQNLVIALSGAPIVLLLAVIQDLCARSRTTRRNRDGKLEWRVKSGL